MVEQRCIFCGGNASEPDHLSRCDGRQGKIEAAIVTPDIRGMVHNDDPFTSVEAAESVEREGFRSDLQRRVLAAFVAHGPMTDSELEQLPEFQGYAYSTVRKRRTELYQRQQIMPIGTRRNDRNRTMLLWAVA